MIKYLKLIIIISSLVILFITLFATKQKAQHIDKAISFLNIAKDLDNSNKQLHFIHLAEKEIELEKKKIKTTKPSKTIKKQGTTIFPKDNPWNQDISHLKVHPNSSQFIQSIGRNKSLHPDFGTFWNGKPNGMRPVFVSSKQKKVFVQFDYTDESDPGPYPIPENCPIEGSNDLYKGGGDRHAIIIDKDSRVLYELFNLYKLGEGKWKAGSGAIFDLDSNNLRPIGWTSADAAGLPIYPGLVRYDEVMIQKEINHALRFTVSKTQRAFILPATHYASHRKDPNLPPMGLRLRLKAHYDISRYPQPVQVILLALKKYGMIVADNGSSLFIQGVHDKRWNDDILNHIKKVKGSNFEAVYTGKTYTNYKDARKDLQKK